MPAHRLIPLLAPESVAIVGASLRPNSPGNDAIHIARRGQFKGRLYAINPKHSFVAGIACYPSLSALPEAVDLVVLVVANARLETIFQE
ncbi:MAG: CoA-binding protein, partial [Gammaproteobacteria bacterium]